MPVLHFPTVGSGLAPSRQSIILNERGKIELTPFPCQLVKRAIIMYMPKCMTKQGRNDLVLYAT